MICTRSKWLLYANFSRSQRIVSSSSDDLRASPYISAITGVIQSREPCGHFAKWARPLKTSTVEKQAIKLQLLLLKYCTTSICNTRFYAYPRNRFMIYYLQLLKHKSKWNAEKELKWMLHPVLILLAHGVKRTSHSSPAKDIPKVPVPEKDQLGTSFIRPKLYFKRTPLKSPLNVLATFHERPWGKIWGHINNVPFRYRAGAHQTILGSF